MRDSEYICEFAVRMGENILRSGGTLERADDTMVRICQAYGYYDTSTFSLYSVISLSLRFEDGYCSRQRSVRNIGTDLSMLNGLNTLSREVCSEKPAPETLEKRLEEVLSRPSPYPLQLILIATMLSQVCLNLILGGTPRDAVCMAVIAGFAWALNRLLDRPALNRIIRNMVVMFVSSVIAVVLCRFGFSYNRYLLLINVGMYLLPGIQMINSVQNLLCGNEVNGSITLIRCLLEIMGLIGGLALAEMIFGGMVIW